MSDVREALAGRVVAVFNTGSGSCDASSDAAAREIFRAAGLSNAVIHMVGPSEVGNALKSAVGEADVLVVLGGDGTIGGAACLCGETGPFLIPLPGGTMNMLPKALYGPDAWQATLKATLANPLFEDRERRGCRWA